MALSLAVSAKDHFQELLGEGMHTLGVQAPPAVQSYLVDLLSFYLDVRNFKLDEIDEAGQRVPATLAEMLLKANQEPIAERRELLKRVGDRALYISGFFGDSLNRKIVDIDYYTHLGQAAYGTLSTVIRDDHAAHVFGAIARQFPAFVEVLTFMSEKSLIQSDESLLRLYEKYVRTGSTTAYARLMEKGIITLPPSQMKKAEQN